MTTTKLGWKRDNQRAATGPLARRIYDRGHLTGEFRVALGRGLRGRGAEIVAVPCVLDRDSGGAANIASEGLELRPAFTMTQVRVAANA